MSCKICEKMLHTLFKAESSSDSLVFANSTYQRLSALLRPSASPRLQTGIRNPAWAVVVLAIVSLGPQATAQDTPLISGAVGFISHTNGGISFLQPVIAPFAAVPIGSSFLIEAR